MKLLAIDGNSIINRAYYGIRPLSNTKGVFTHAIFGFMNIYLKNVNEIKPDAVAVAFDLRSPTFRHKAVDTYKATRKGMPEELAMQLPYLKELLGRLGIPIVTCEGYEADDILGTLAALCTAQEADCYILTGDRDSLQLISDHVTVRLATNKETISYTPERFREEYHFEPLSLIDLKALMGDSSDNISGVAGIGKVTASKLIQEWTTIENLYAHLDTAKLTKSVQNKLTAGLDAAKQSKWLATIVTDVPIPGDLSTYLLKPVQTEAARELLLELEMAKLIDKLKLNGSTFQKADEAETVPEEIPQQITESRLTETQLLQWENTNAIPAVLFDGTAVHLLLPDEPQTVYLTDEEGLIRRIFQMQRLTFGAKPQYRWLLAQGITPDSINPSAADAEIAAYLLNSTSSEYQIERLCVTYHVPYHKSLGDHAPLAALPKLYDAMHKKVAEQDMLQLMDYEQQLTVVLAAMEHNGFYIDRNGVEQFGVFLSEKIEEMQQLVYDEAGHPFNIGSPKQLGEVLFVEMQLPHGKKTKTGYSTNAEILEKLSGQYAIVNYVLKWRQFSKLKSTYVDGLLKNVGEDGRIHTVFRQTETRTGRISSTEPNLQNIPVRTELGRNMRKFFAAQKGCVLLDADYSQIELRLLANLSGDKQMREAFLSGADIHAATAAQVFDMPIEMVTSEMRSAAKAVNFGILYGMGAFSLSQDIHVSVQQANQYIQNYMAQFPSVGAFMDKIVGEAKLTGYVSTYFKRRRPVPELLASNKMVQAAGKRIAMNTPIQGTAADIIKLAMIHVYQRLQSDVPAARLILQVHDELIVEVPQIYAVQAAKVLGEEMQNVIRNSLPPEEQAQFPVPLTADVSMGETWYEAKG